MRATGAEAEAEARPKAQRLKWRKEKRLKHVRDRRDHVAPNERKPRFPSPADAMTVADSERLVNLQSTVIG